MVKKKYIVVEGPIGVGKTTLAERLADDLKARPLLEQVEGHPLLEQFYAKPAQLALPTQLHFLLHRVEQLETLINNDEMEPRVVADYLLDKDRLFAQTTLNEVELDIYERIFQRIVVAAPKPDLVIYLQAPVAVLLARVSARGRTFERAIDSTYLQQLNDAYARYFHYYDETPLLIVNAAEINFATNEQDYQQLFDQIGSIDRGRHYFNPITTREN